MSSHDTSYVDGTVRWDFRTGHQITSSPAVGADGTIYVGSWDEDFYAINPDGTERWSYSTDGFVKSSPTIAEDGTIYVGSDDGYLYAFDSEGSLKWRYRPSTWSASIASSPSIGEDGTIYVGCFDNSLYAVNPDGTERWEFETEGNIFSSPAINEDGTIYVGSWDGNLYAINPNGTEKWRFETNDNIYSSPSIAVDGTIYVGSDDEKLYAINPDGTERWNYSTGGRVYSSPAIAEDGTIYVGSGDNHIYAMDPDGTEKWSLNSNGPIRSSPVVGGDGTVYFGNDVGLFYGVNPNGTQRWRINVGAILLSSPAIGGDGSIYFGCFDNNLYAIGGVPSAPLNVEATPGSGIVQLTWDPPLEMGGGGFQGYKIYRGTSMDDMDFLANEDTTSYLDEGLTGGRTYNYYITAVSGDGEGEESDVVSATPSIDWTLLDHMEIDPRDETAIAGREVDYRAIGYDENKREIADLTEDTEWSIMEGAGGSWDGSRYAAEHAGEWTVTGIYIREGIEFTDQVSLTVEPGAVNYIEISPSGDQTIKTGETVSFSAEAYDEYGNLIPDPLFTWVNADENGVFDKRETGVHEVSARIGGVSSERVKVTVEDRPGFLSNYWWLLILPVIVVLLVFISKRRKKETPVPPEIHGQEGGLTH